MPQGGDPSAARARASAYQCTLLQGLVWVRLKPAPADGSPPDTSAVPTIPELDDDAWFGFGDMWRDIPYDYATLIENVIDAGHVPFTHHGSVSRRQSSGNFEGGGRGARGVQPPAKSLPAQGGCSHSHAPAPPPPPSDPSPGCRHASNREGGLGLPRRLAHG